MYNSMLFDSLFVEEHITIYNRHLATEKYFIPLQLMDKSPRALTKATAVKESHQFISLEGTITEFAQRYTQIWNQILSLRPEMAHALVDLAKADGKGALDSLERTDMHAKLQRDSHINVVAELNMLCDELSNLVEAHAHDRDGQKHGREPVGAAADARSSIPPELGKRYSELFFEFYYITDELVFFAHRYEGHGQRFAYKLASLLYTIVFRHRIFQRFTKLAARGGKGVRVPRLLGQWMKQLDHFLSFIPMCTPSTEILWSLSRSFVAEDGRGGSRKGDIYDEDRPG